jgi:hypothetical protein
MGLALLLFRLHVRESLLFRRLEGTRAGQGNWFRLLWPWSTLEKYLACTLLGIAPLFCLYFYGGFTPELGQELALVGDLKINRAAMAMFAGMAVGDLLISWLSYRLQSRKRPLLYFLLASAAIQSVIMLCHGVSVAIVYALFLLLGMTAANALYVTTVAEQFGTDLRDTATTTVTNFIRFGAVPLGIVLTSWKGGLGLAHAGFLISLGTTAVGVVALSRLKESYGSIDYVEA